LAVSIRVPKPNITAIVPTKIIPNNTIAKFSWHRPMYINKQSGKQQSGVETLVSSDTDTNDNDFSCVAKHH
jgi:hypothetical protein